LQTIQAQFESLILDRRLRKLSLTESFHLAQGLAGLSPHHLVPDPFLELLYTVSEEILDELENEGSAKAALGIEPAYHNREHFADAVLALSFLLSQISHFSANEKQLLLLTMLVHDFGHRGMGNAPPFGMSHEEESVALLKNSAMMKLPGTQQAKIFELIIGTTTKKLKEINERYRLEPNNADYLMQALINDADIICSFAPALKEKLTEYVLIESGIQNPSKAQIHDAHQEFQKNFFLTTDLARLIYQPPY
jgi:hypothetical protein